MEKPEREREKEIEKEKTFYVAVPCVNSTYVIIFVEWENPCERKKVCTPLLCKKIFFENKRHFSARAKETLYTLTHTKKT